MEFSEWLRSIGGVCTLQSALERVSKSELAAMRGTTIWSPLRGWVALVGQHDDVTRALRAGGVATCVTAFAKHGMWVPHGPQQLHVRVNRETHSDRVAAARRTPGIALHRMHGWLPDTRPRTGVDAPIEALAAATGCLPEDEVVAAADSALALRLVTAADLDELVARLPRRRRRALERATRLSGSGTESMVAAMLRRAGVAFVQQAELRPRHFVDFLIGRSLVVEVDSARWHASPQQQANDRARDAALVAMGYRVLRFTYEQVVFQPEWVLESVLAVVRRGGHRRSLWA